MRAISSSDTRTMPFLIRQQAPHRLHGNSLEVFVIMPISIRWPQAVKYIKFPRCNRGRFANHPRLRWREDTPPCHHPQSHCSGPLKN